MPSLLARLAPLVIFFRGSHRMFSSAELTRARVDRLSVKPDSYEPTAALEKRVDIRHSLVDGKAVYVLSPKTASSGKEAIYFHGGSWVFEIDPVQWSFVVNLVEATGATITVPIYKLAPHETAAQTTPFLTGLAAAMVEHVGVANSTILGDSAGGTMALVTAMQLRDRGVGAIRTVLVAPLGDATFSAPEVAELAKDDPWLAVPGNALALDLYRGELPLYDPLVSPINGNFAGLGPLTIFTGTRDLLNHDAHAIADAARAAGVPVDFHEGQRMIHNYPILPMPEGVAARRVIEAVIES